MKCEKECYKIRICELSQKEVINICDGQRLGYVSDVIFDVCTGCITDIIIPGPCKIWGIMGRDHEYIINFKCIKQIGNEVVLVEVETEKVFFKCKF